MSYTLKKPYDRGRTDDWGRTGPLPVQRPSLGDAGYKPTQDYSQTKPGTAQSPAQGAGSAQGAGKAPSMSPAQPAQNPGYSSQWTGQMNDLMAQYMNREPFQYDINQDALYQQYVDQYVKGGQLAMMDTMGQAQAMTGGYGNSYAQMAGQQAYQGYLGQLNQAVPELYQQALDRYMQEGDALAQRYSMLADRENQDYARYLEDRNYLYQQERDQAADSQWQAEMDEDRRRYDQEWNRKYGRRSGGGGGAGGGGAEEAGLSAEERSMLQLNYGPLTPDELAGLIEDGEVSVTVASDGTYRYERTKKSGGGGGGPKSNKAHE